MSLFSALRAGMSAPVLSEDEIETAPPGATHAGTGETEVRMTEQEHLAAVAAAKTEGEKAGADKERARFGAIFGADGVKGDATKIGAAMDMATQFPDATAEQVVDFVGKHARAATVPPATPSSASLAERMKADAAAGGEGKLPVTGADDGPKKKSGLLALAQARFPKKEG